MDKDNKAIDGPAVAPEPTVTPTVDPTEDNEARFAQLEAEKLKYQEEAANYRMAFIKEKNKTKENLEGESDDDRIRRITQETLADSKLAEITRQQDALILKTLKENRELKLAHLNKSNTPPAAVGTHSEGIPVRDTVVTPDQMTYFKSIGKDDKWIERYKKNLQKNTR